jgi:hypothetical protein
MPAKYLEELHTLDNFEVTSSASNGEDGGAGVKTSSNTPDSEDR